MGKNVTVYTTPTCGYCRDVKRFLTEKGVEFREVDVSTDANAAWELVVRTRQYGVPVIDVGGTYIIGFDRHRLEHALSAA